MTRHVTSSAAQSTTGENASQGYLPPPPEAGAASDKGKGVKETDNAGDDTEGTFRYQSGLPKLEVPPLDETLGKYLDAVAPLLSPEAFSRTKAVVEEVRELLACVLYV